MNTKKLRGNQPDWFKEKNGAPPLTKRHIRSLTRIDWSAVDRNHYSYERAFKALKIRLLVIGEYGHRGLLMGRKNNRLWIKDEEGKINLLFKGWSYALEKNYFLIIAPEFKPNYFIVRTGHVYV